MTGLVSVSIMMIIKMSVVNMAQNIKNIHPDYMIMYKVGGFYNCYGKDAYIASYLNIK